MEPGIIFGISAAIVTFTLTAVLPATSTWALIWGALAVDQGIGALIVWRRTSLHALTLSFLWAATIAVGFAGAAYQGVAFNELLRQDGVLVVIVLAIPVLLQFVDKGLHPDAWQRLNHASRASSALDVLLFRHIPKLHGDAAALH